MKPRPRDSTPGDPPPARPRVASGSRALIGHVGRLVAGDAVSKLSRFLALALLARSLTAADFGKLNLGIALAGLLFTMTSLGLSEAGARHVARAPADAGWYAGRVIVARSVALFLVALALFAAAVFLAPTVLLLVVGACLMAQMMILGADWLARGLERTGALAASSAVGGLVVVAGVLFIRAYKPNANTALAVFAGGEAGAALVAWILVTRYVKPRLGLGGVRALATEARPLAISAFVLYAYYSSLDTIIIAATRSNSEAGLYAAPYRLFLMFTIVGTFSAYAMLPARVRAAQAGLSLADDPMVRRAIPVLAAYGLTVVAGVELLGPWLLGVLFGARFETAESTLLVLACGVCWYAVGFPVGYALIAEGRYGRFRNGATIAAASNVLLDLLLIPSIGYVGAGIATVVSVIAATVVWLAYQRLLAVMRRVLAAAGIATTAGAASAIVPGIAWVAGAITLSLAAVTITGVRHCDRCTN